MNNPAATCPEYGFTIVIYKEDAYSSSGLEDIRFEPTGYDRLNYRMIERFTGTFRLLYEEDVEKEPLSYKIPVKLPNFCGEQREYSLYGNLNVTISNSWGEIKATFDDASWTYHDPALNN